MFRFVALQLLFILPVFLYCDSITFPKCPLPNTLSRRNASIVNPLCCGGIGCWRCVSNVLSLYCKLRATWGRRFCVAVVLLGIVDGISATFGNCGYICCGVVGCCTIGGCDTYWALLFTFKLSNVWTIYGKCRKKENVILDKKKKKWSAFK